MPVETFGVASAQPPGQSDQAHGQNGSFTMVGSHADVPPFDVPCWLMVQSSSRTTSCRKRVGKPEVESVTAGIRGGSLKLWQVGHRRKLHSL